MWGCLKYGLSLTALFLAPSKGQDKTNRDKQACLGNKFTFGKNRWKQSIEWKVRLKDNLQELDNWFVEYVASYLTSNLFEIVPDFRFTISIFKKG